MNNQLRICGNLNKGGGNLLKFLQIILSITAISLAGYGVITEDFKFQPYMMLFLGLTMLVMGLREFQKGQKGFGSLPTVVLLYLFYLYQSKVSY